MRSRIVAGMLAVWTLTAVAAYAAINVTGVVKDPSDAVVAGATVLVMTAEQTVVVTTPDRCAGEVQSPGSERGAIPAGRAGRYARRGANATDRQRPRPRVC